jgi:hypothetical protein
MLAEIFMLRLEALSRSLDTQHTFGRRDIRFEPYDPERAPLVVTAGRVPGVHSAKTAAGAVSQEAGGAKCKSA